MKLTPAQLTAMINRLSPKKKMMSLDKLWKCNCQTNVLLGEKTPEELLEILNLDHEEIITFLFEKNPTNEFLHRDIGSVAWWVRTLTPFREENKAIPTEYAIKIDPVTNKIVDGRHRLVSARILQFVNYPVIYPVPIWNPV
jgi:hypothetical protein